MISYEQDVKIKNFIERLKSKGKIYGTIHISIFDDGFSIDHEVFLDSDVSEAEQIGFETGQDTCIEDIEKMSAIDLSEYIDEETAIELYEYYKSKR